MQLKLRFLSFLFLLVVVAFADKRAPPPGEAPPRLPCEGEQCDNPDIVVNDVKPVREKPPKRKKGSLFFWRNKREVQPLEDDGPKAPEWSNYQDGRDYVEKW